MRIATVGSPNRIEELKEKISSTHELIEVKNNQFEGFDLIFDLSFDHEESDLQPYKNLSGIPVVVGAVNQTIEEALLNLKTPASCQVYGINSMPTFLNRPLAEMTSVDEHSRDAVERLFKELNWPIKWVESRVGMVTPRIICMIINEAYYTVQEGTATKEDINIGMKLGTAYPKGPFEWAEEIGLDAVYSMLTAIYEDTKDERYKICPLLKQEFIQSQIAVQL